MRECRYKDGCVVNEINSGDDDYIPCDGMSDESLCWQFEPMPDVEALLKLASRMEADVNEALYFEMTFDPYDVAEYADKIREAVGA